MSTAARRAEGGEEAQKRVARARLFARAKILFGLTRATTFGPHHLVHASFIYIHTQIQIRYSSEFTQRTIEQSWTSRYLSQLGRPCAVINMHVSGRQLRRTYIKERRLSSGRICCSRRSER
jgi:hypothetical protein